MADEESCWKKRGVVLFVVMYLLCACPLDPEKVKGRVVKSAKCGILAVDESR